MLENQQHCCAGYDGDGSSDLRREEVEDRTTNADACAGAFLYSISNPRVPIKQLRDSLAAVTIPYEAYEGLFDGISWIADDGESVDEIARFSGGEF